MATVTLLAPTWMRIDGKTNYYYAGDTIAVDNDYAETLLTQYRGRITVRMSQDSSSSEEKKDISTISGPTEVSKPLPEIAKEVEDDYPLPLNTTAKSILDLLEELSNEEVFNAEFVRKTKERYPDFKTVQKECDRLLEEN